MTQQPIRLTVPQAPDSDWEGIRDRVLAELADDPAQPATDQNLADPGVTVAEVAAFALADIHYRVAQAGFHQWPLTWPGWLPEPDRHWRGSLDQANLSAVAAALADVSDELEPRVRDAASRPDAQMLVRDALAGSVDSTHLAVDLLRSAHVRRHGLERADTIADAVQWADRRGGALAERDARAASLLGPDLPLWPDEIEQLIDRERRRLAIEVATGFAARVRNDTTGTQRLVLTDDMIEAGLSAEEAAAALALPRIPADATPEDQERGDGATMVWPPHPLQALACEPVTAGDYASRARLHPEVTRAWTVAGRLEGIAWNGVAVRPDDGWPDLPSPLLWPLDVDAPALTVVVEWTRARQAQADGTPVDRKEVESFLREVVADTITDEVTVPFAGLLETSATPRPRRVVCDEVGAALVRYTGVVVNATLVLAPLAGAAAARADAESRVREFFDRGRLESAGQAADPTRIDGPWPPAAQPVGGWVPGEAIRFSEVIEAIAGVPGVRGVRDVFMRRPDQTALVHSDVGELTLPSGAVPVLAAGGCFTVASSTTEACTNA